MQNLVIVESPTKARTLSRYLGGKYQVEASMGHVRDLPKADFGIDVEDGFKPRYIIPRDKTKRVNELKKLALEAQTLWLATDPDREGEAIAWHLGEILKMDGRKLKVGVESKKLKGDKKGAYVHRVVFHEITEDAIKEAFEDPRQIDMRLVDAQQARRVLDRVVGYRLSPLLWKKVKSGLSAGRVQSVALRLIVEREKEVQAFKPQEYWSIEGEFKSKEETLTAALIEQNGKKLTIKSKSEADKHVQVLEKAEYLVAKVTKKEVKKYPSPPFTTSTLQQTAATRLGFTAKKTMMLAQFLYEHGLITYMRTDSTNISTQALAQSRSFIEQSLGRAYLPPRARVFKTKSKLAQEAHEAIRPTNIGHTSEELKKREGITRDHLKLYDLIWKRMVASQMSEAIFDATTVDVRATLQRSENYYLFRSSGSVVKFDGWLKIYEEKFQLKAGPPLAEKDEEVAGEQVLPELQEGELLKLLQLLPEQHFTEPPPRYHEASLIKKLEELGIGRPSTYASILSVIQERYYVEKKERKFFPTELGKAVLEFLVRNFPDLLDYGFTAQMEDELDEVAQGERQWGVVIRDFYTPFEKKLSEVEKKAGKVEIETEEVDKDCPKCGKKLLVRFGRFGKFLGCSGFPGCDHTENIEEEVGVKCPDCGGEVVIKRTKRGRPFYGCQNYPNCKFASWTKPKRQGLTR